MGQFEKIARKMLCVISSALVSTFFEVTWESAQCIFVHIGVRHLTKGILAYIPSRPSTQKVERRGGSEDIPDLVNIKHRIPTAQLFV